MKHYILDILYIPDSGLNYINKKQITDFISVLYLQRISVSRGKRRQAQMSKERGEERCILDMDRAEEGGSTALILLHIVLSSVCPVTLKERSNPNLSKILKTKLTFFPMQRTQPLFSEIPH